MTAITTSQLDELEALGKSNPVHFVLPYDVTLRLVAVYRAALAWSEAYSEMIGAQYAAVDGSKVQMKEAAVRYHAACHALVDATKGAP